MSYWRRRWFRRINQNNVELSMDADELTFALWLIAVCGLVSVGTLKGNDIVTKIIEKRDAAKVEQYFEEHPGHYQMMPQQQHIIQVPLLPSMDGTIQVPYPKSYKLLRLEVSDSGIKGVYVNKQDIWCEPEQTEADYQVCLDFGISKEEILDIAYRREILSSDYKEFAKGRHILLVPIITNDDTNFDIPEGYAISTSEALSIPGYRTYINTENVGCIATRIDQSGHMEFSEFGIPTSIKTEKILTK